MSFSVINDPPSRNEGNLLFSALDPRKNIGAFRFTSFAHNFYSISGCFVLPDGGSNYASFEAVWVTSGGTRGVAAAITNG